ncbi:chemotaxis protein CheW [Allohahella sp. A8]|uniref:chemotaxis protein CheW n=1 Tax=Allohahella sp. A8 TaxID=3141461 RepID=UPI003A807DB8
MSTLARTSQRQPLLKPSEAFARLQSAQSQSSSVKPKQAWRESFAVTLTQGLSLLIPESYPKELIEAPSICTVPYGPQWLSGFLNARGQVIPVIELDALFGNAAAPASHTSVPYVLLLGQGSDAFAVAISQLPKKVRLSDDHRLQQPPPLPSRLEGCVGRIYQKEGLWCEWDLTQFMRSLI